IIPATLFRARVNRKHGSHHLFRRENGDVSPDRTSVKIPQSLGRYEVVDLIGQGGMGALSRPRDPRIGRYVAIKLLRPGYDTPELRDRFSREARAAGC